MSSDRLAAILFTLLILGSSAPAGGVENATASRQGFSLLGIAALSPTPTIATVWGGGLEAMYTWALTERIDANIPLTFAAGGGDYGLIALTSGFLFGFVAGEAEKVRLVFLAGPEVVGILVDELKSAQSEDGNWLVWKTSLGGWGIGARGGARVVVADNLLLEASSVAAVVPSPEPFYLLVTFGAGFLF